MISHKHKVIFVHIPKCGGQSIETLFLDDLGLTWQSRLPLLLFPNTAPRVGPPVLSHLLASEYVRFGYVSDEIFNSYFKFAYVRNPFSRVVSTFNYKEKMIRLTKRMKDYPHTLEDFVTNWLPKEFNHKPVYETYPHKYPGNYYFLRPQSDFVYGEDGKPMVDVTYQLEGIKENHKEILGYLHNDKIRLRHVNAPETRAATVADLTPKMQQIIVDLYKDDFANFGYDTQVRLSAKA